MNEIVNKINNTYDILLQTSATPNLSIRAAADVDTIDTSLTIDNNNQNRLIKNPNNYFNIKKSTSVKSKKRIITKKRRSFAGGYITDASESSFDSSLVDCFNSLATYSDSDDYYVFNNKKLSFKFRTKSRYSSNGIYNRFKYQRCSQQASSNDAKRLVKRLNAANRARSKRKFIVFATNTTSIDNDNNKLKYTASTSNTDNNELNSQKKKRSCKINKNINENNNKNAVENDDVPMETDIGSCLSDEDDDDNDDANDQSSITETDDREADDEQSDWPVNEPSTIKWNNKTNENNNDASNSSSSINIEKNMNEKQEKRKNKEESDNDDDEDDDNTALKRIFNNTFKFYKTKHADSCSNSKTNFATFHNRVNNLIINRQFKRGKRRYYVDSIRA